MLKFGGRYLWRFGDLNNKMKKIWATVVLWCRVSFSSFERKKVNVLGRVWLFATPWTVAYQAPLSMGFSGQEYCSGLPFLSPVHSVQFSQSIVSDFLQPHGLQTNRFHTPRACSNSCPLSQYAIQPSHPLSSPSPPALNLSQHQGLFQWVSPLCQVAKVLEFQLQHQSFQWTPRTDLL